ncbi:MAG: excinuclease ABC subunit UvrC [Proteobacteria bacterium]|nr:excinuclease ABC subunit UvrC [Pseudomonadota bacterium]
MRSFADAQDDKHPQDGTDHIQNKIASNFDPKLFIKTLPSLPGIYQMVNTHGEIIYVGKANNLKSRVSSYFQKSNQGAKTKSLVQQIAGIEIILTHSETEALLLENNLIKKLKPKYNILLRDDKTYPYIHLTDHPDFPRLDFYRGRTHGKGKYFGPYPSSLAVRESLHFLQKLFRIRSCKDSFFRNRTRPCLQHYINRCTAPCVNLIDKATYQKDIRHAVMFLEGKNESVINELVKRMEESSQKRHFEEAAQYRDQIAQLRKVQETQYVTKQEGNLDVIAIVSEKEWACIYVLSFREGRLLGSQDFLIELPISMDISEVLETFLTQFYLNPIRQSDLPDTILLNQGFSNLDSIAALFHQELKKKIILQVQGRTQKKQWLNMAAQNAKQKLNVHLASKSHFLERFYALQSAMNLAALPEDLACFDISHTFGESTVASCVVFDREGPKKTEYRRFNIQGIKGGDDYAALHQAVNRHFTQLLTNEKKLPDILFIDGGKGQVHEVVKALSEIQIHDIIIIGIAKGPARKPGLETLILWNEHQEVSLPSDSPALHLIQQIRDESHRFAITGHRKQRDKKRKVSYLENIPGIGQKRSQELLKHFGGLQDLKVASIESIAQVPGINRSLAERIYQALHS